MNGYRVEAAYVIGGWTQFVSKMNLQRAVIDGLALSPIAEVRVTEGNWGELDSHLTAGSPAPTPETDIQRLDRLIAAKRRETIDSNDVGFNVGLATARDCIRTIFGLIGTPPLPAPPATGGETK